MSNVKNENQEDNLKTVETALTKTEQFIEDNQKTLITIVLAIVALVLCYVAFNRFIISPREKEAQSQMFIAEQYFAKDSFNLALNGDGNYMGFIEVIDEYGFTKSANLANAYAGISYLRLGKYEKAIEYLKDFDADDHIISPIALGATGDAYSELGQNEKAVNFYVKAYEKSNNEFTSPIYMMKAAKTYELLKEYKSALKIYEKLKETFPKTQEGRNAEKYIARAKAKSGIE